MRSRRFKAFELMRVVRFFRDSITGQLILLMFFLLVFLLLAVQCGINQTYQNSLQDQLVSIETKSLRMQAQNLNALLRPYLNYLYDRATDYHLVSAMYNDQEPLSRSASINRLRSAFFNTARGIYYLRSMGTIYQDGSCVFYEKGERLSDFWRSSGIKARQNIHAMALDNHYPVSLCDEEKNYVYVAVPAISVDHPRESATACVVAAYDFSFLESFMRESDSNSTHGYLVDRAGQIISCSDNARFSQPFDSLQAGSKLLALSRQVNSLGWSLNILVDKEVLLESLTSAGKNVNLFYIFSLLLLTILLILFFHSLLTPVRRMSAAMEAVGQGDMSVKIPVAGKNELWQLACHFNRMMHRLDNAAQLAKQHSEEALEAEKRKRQTELKLLESHINAHFLFNSLNTINMQALECGSRAVSTSIKRLANIMRYAFDTKMSFVRLYQEAAWAEQYLYMQRERIGEGFSYDISIDENVADWPFRKMILQPFLENSIIHGLSGRDDGVLLVTARRGERDTLLLVITDNGCGMREDTCTEIRQILQDPTGSTKNGIGIANAAERIFSFFGPRALIEIESTFGKGTTFTMTLPLPEGFYIGDTIDEEEEEIDEIY